MQFRETDRKKQIVKQIDNKTDKQTNRKTNRKTNKDTRMYAHITTCTHAHARSPKHTHKHTVRVDKVHFLLFELGIHVVRDIVVHCIVKKCFSNNLLGSIGSKNSILLFSVQSRV